MHTDENMVISAPTGSGKTVLFELAIIRMLTQASGNGKTDKCIYVAPTKALCSEKCRDWTAKFQPLGVNCCELTGDTVHFGKSAWGNARDASVMFLFKLIRFSVAGGSITTGEKWDSLTRNWRDHGQILSQIQLFLVDEVHILNESRGSTLEVILSRMKTRGSSVRFLVVSATVPNIEDVASWIGDGTSDGSATIMQFGEDFRPCILSKFVYGIPRKRDHNDFAYQRTLDYRLYSILQRHSANKPVLVFCSTRKGVMATAEQIMKEYEEATEKKQLLPWTRPPRIEQNFANKRLEKLAACGIGIHHAGMSMSDRRATEELYLKKLLRIVFATSTLAVGVNLPAHTVVIKGVKIFQNNTSQEYSDLDIMQMMGRAGRPQFDKEGVAIIMCETELEAKYKALVQGQTVLESCLHLNLSEHINSEVGLGTITDLDTAKKWLHSSFLYRRIKKNPKHYAIGKESGQTWQERIDDMVTQSVEKLQETELITYSDENHSRLCSTEYGDIMSKFYVRQSTMSLILKLPERATSREILEMISNAEEFSGIKIRGGEKQVYNKMREHNDIRFQIKKVEKPADKVFMLIQAVLGGISLSDSEYKSGDTNPGLEAVSVFRHVPRVAKAAVEVAIVKKAGAQIKHGLEVMRCLNARAWEDRPVVLRQIEHIGEKSLKVLAEHNITTFTALRRQDPLRLEALLNRRPPFGHEMLASVNQFPQYLLKIIEKDMTTHGGEKPIEIELSIECGLVTEGSTTHRQKKKGKPKVSDMTVVLTLTSDLEFIDFRRIPTKALRESKSFSVTYQLTKPSQSVTVHIASEDIAGVTVTETYKPKVAAENYPTMDTRPQSSLDMMLEGLDDDPDFWNMGPDDEDIPKATHMKTSETGDSPLKHKFESGKSSTGNKADVKGGASPLKTLLGPKRLSNGNYECNHTCKNKTKCRHMCCRDGVPKPPPLSKRRVEILCADDYPQDKSSKLQSALRGGFVHDIQVEDAVKAKPKPKLKPCDRSDARLQHLETLHEHTNVSENLKLSSGRRIKLQDQRTAKTQSKGKQNAVPNFDINFMRLNDGDPSIPDLSEVDGSDVDLPEPRELLNAHIGSMQQGERCSDLSETDYSNSEIDALIRVVPLCDSQDGDDPDKNGPTGDCARRTSTLPQHPPRQATPYSSPDRKRKRGGDSAPSTPKRSRSSNKHSDAPSISFPVQTRKKSQSSAAPPTECNEKQERLFLTTSSDEEDSTLKVDVDASPKDETVSPRHSGQLAGNDDFVVDESLFRILSATSSPPTSLVPKPYKTCPATLSSDRDFLQPLAGPCEPIGQDSAKVYHSTYEWEDEDPDPGSYNKGLEDLEAWLQSGAVEIIE
ncbi:hypothetical protein AcV7_008716 [Taiwanofungus camphoratus]|nr:hypothetical protein AcV7_008716 [Antrodia cinnamomea]